MKDITKNALRIVNIILLAIALVFLIINLVSLTGIFLALNIVEIYVLASAVLYCFYGYKKESAQYYNLFIYSYAIVQLFRIAIGASHGLALDAVFVAIVFGGISVLAETKDYGKKRSMIVGLVVLAACIASIVFNLTTGGPRAVVFSCFAELVNALLLNVMILAKYEDKDERGSN